MEKNNYFVTSQFPDKEVITYGFLNYGEALDRFVELCADKGRLCGLVGGEFVVQLKSKDKVIKSLTLNATDFNHS